MYSFRPAGAGGGIFLFSLGVLFFALNDALGKWLVVDYSVAQLMFLRSLGAAVVLAPLLWQNRRNFGVEGQWGLHVLRVCCMAADAFSFYFATRFLPLADVMTFYLAAPLIITALSGPLLGEAVGLSGWIAVVVGFVGVLIALHPSGAAFSPAAGIALLGSMLFALAITVTRKLRDTHWVTLVTCQFAGAGLIGAVVCPFGWVAPLPVDLGLMFLVGIVAMVCFICITKALSLAPAAVVAPFQYASIVWAVILGWLVWGDVPSLNMVLGSLVIVASGLFIVYRERLSSAASPPCVDPVP